MNASQRATLANLRQLDLQRIQTDIGVALDAVLDDRSSRRTAEEIYYMHAIAGLKAAIEGLGQAQKEAAAAAREQERQRKQVVGQFESSLQLVRTVNACEKNGAGR